MSEKLKPEYYIRSFHRWHSTPS